MDETGEMWLFISYMARMEESKKPRISHSCRIIATKCFESSAPDISEQGERDAM